MGAAYITIIFSSIIVIGIIVLSIWEVFHFNKSSEKPRNYKYNPYDTYNKGMKVIQSCKSYDQLLGAHRYVDSFKQIYPCRYYSTLWTNLDRALYIQETTLSNPQAAVL